MFGLLWVLTWSAPRESSGQTFHWKQEVTVSAFFRLCTFLGCWSPERGGAIFSFGASIDIRLMDCTFDNCSSADGGALFVLNASSFSMVTSSGKACRTTTFHSFCYVLVSSGSLSVTDSSVSSCEGTDETMTFAGYGRATPRCSVLALNSSRNIAHDHGGGLGLWTLSSLAFKRCTFSGNSPANCLEFGDGLVDTNDISCLDLVNNSCHSSVTAPGLLCVGADLNIARSLFRANRFDYFVGCPWGKIGRVTFSMCSFDIEILTSTRNVSVSKYRCQCAAWPTMPAECAAPPTQQPPVNVAIRRLLIVVIVLLVLVSALCCRRNNAPANPGPANQGPANQGPANQGPANQGPANQGPANPDPVNEGPANPDPVNEVREMDDKKTR